MAINFPSDRSELGFPPGPLQPGDLWVNNRIEYLWFESPDGTGAWSAKGANIDPSNYINKAEQFPAELDGSFNTGFTIADADRADNATLADEASKVTNTLKLNFTDASGNTTSIEYDGSTPKEISFSDTDINSQEVNLTPGFGIDISNDEISVVPNTPRAWSAGAAPGSSSNYAAEFTSGIWSKLKAYQADNAANLGGTPAASYYTAVQVDNRISQSVGNVDLTTAFDNQANTPITGANANLELNANGTEFIVDLAKSADGDPARLELGQSNARSVIDSDGNAFFANPIFPHMELRGRKANTSFGYGFIGLTTGNPADIGAFVRSPQTNDRELIIQGETVRIRDAANPDGWVLAPPDGTNGGISHAQGQAGVTYGSRDGGWVAIAADSGIPEPIGANGNYVRQLSDGAGSWALLPEPEVNVESLNDINDVVISNPAADDQLVYNGNAWVNVAPTATSFEGGDVLHRNTRFNIKQEMDDASVNATEAFNRAINWVYDNFDTPSIYFPSGNYDIASMGVTFPYNTSKTQISIFGDGKGEGTTINCSGTIFVGHPVNIKGIKFVGKVNGPTLMFRRVPANSNDASNPLEDDMDSTITSCDFGNGGSDGYGNACDIDYRGRNLIVTNCKFITGGASGNAIRLSYFCNENEVVSQDEVGWKRIMITNNNFHNFDGGAIVLGSSQNTANRIRPRLRGLVLANNTMETDGVFLSHAAGSNCRLEGAAITGNTLLIFRDRAAIDLQTVYASSIVGNTFNGYADDGRLINVHIDDAWATTITGNVFNSGQGSGGANGGALTGNTWRGCIVSANTWFGASTGRIEITNTPDCDIQTPVGTPFEP